MFGMTEKDSRIVKAVTEEYCGMGYGYVITEVIQIFKEDIKPGHYLLAGFYMGEMFATRNANNNLKQITSCKVN